MADAQRDVDLKDENEVADYLERLGVEYRFGCYYEKDGKACDLLGSYMDQINQDPQKAFKIFQAACDEYKFGRSCSKVGSYYFAGKVVNRDLDKAYEYWRKGCDNGVKDAPCARACLNAGLLDSLDPGTKIGGFPGFKNPDKHIERKEEPDKLRAMDLFKKSCDMNMNPSAEGCHRYAAMLINGMKDLGIERDPAKALPYATKGCDLGNIQACVNSSVIYKTGDGVEKNPRMAKIYSNIVKDMASQYEENKERTRFQEGAESGHDIPL